MSTCQVVPDAIHLRASVEKLPDRSSIIQEEFVVGVPKSFLAKTDLPSEENLFSGY